MMIFVFNSYLSDPVTNMDFNENNIMTVAIIYISEYQLHSVCKECREIFLIFNKTKLMVFVKVMNTYQL